MKAYVLAALVSVTGLLYIHADAKTLESTTLSSIYDCHAHALQFFKEGKQTVQDYIVTDNMLGSSYGGGAVFVYSRDKAFTCQIPHAEYRDLKATRYLRLQLGTERTISVKYETYKKTDVVEDVSLLRAAMPKRPSVQGEIVSVDCTSIPTAIAVEKIPKHSTVLDGYVFDLTEQHSKQGKDRVGKNEIHAFDVLKTCQEVPRYEDDIMNYLKKSSSAAKPATQPSSGAH